MEFGDSSKILNAAFDVIRKTQLDPIATALNKLPAKRTQVINLKNQILAPISDYSCNSLEKVVIIIKDLDDIFRKLAEFEEFGIEWTSDNFSCTHVDCDDLREQLLFRKKFLEKKAKHAADEEKAENDVYMKNLKARPLPRSTLRIGLSFFQLGKLRNCITLQKHNSFKRGNC